MIDNFTLLVTTALIVMVMVRAVKLDAILPWFDPRPTEELLRKEAAKRGRRRSWQPSGTPVAADKRHSG